MSDKINVGSMAANMIVGNNNLRGSGRISEGCGVKVTQVKEDKGGGKEGKQDWKKVDEDEEDEEDEDVEEGEETVAQPSTRDPKPADWEHWTRERQKAWLAPRKAARKARKAAARQKQQEHQWAVEPAAAETVSERTQEMTRPQIESYSQTAQFLPSQQYQQGRLSGYTSGRGELPSAAYQTLHSPANPLPARPLTWVSPSYSQAFPPPYHTPQQQPDYKSGLGNTHALPTRPALSPNITASASPAVKPRYRKIEMAEVKKFETYEQTVERVRGEERKKLEEEWRGVEEERGYLEWEKKEMEEEWKNIGQERKEMEEEWKKIGQERKELEEEKKKVEKWMEGDMEEK